MSPLFRDFKKGSPKNRQSKLKRDTPRSGGFGSWLSGDAEAPGEASGGATGREVGEAARPGKSGVVVRSDVLTPEKYIRTHTHAQFLGGLSGRKDSSLEREVSLKNKFGVVEDTRVWPVKNQLRKQELKCGHGIWGSQGARDTQKKRLHRELRSLNCHQHCPFNLQQFLFFKNCSKCCLPTRLPACLPACLPAWAWCC